MKKKSFLLVMIVFINGMQAMEKNNNALRGELLTAIRMRDYPTNKRTRPEFTERINTSPVLNSQGKCALLGLLDDFDLETADDDKWAGTSFDGKNARTERIRASIKACLDNPKYKGPGSKDSKSQETSPRKTQ